MFRASLSQPKLVIGKRVNCNGTKQLKAEPKKLAQRKPSLLDDPEFVADAYYLDLHFTPHVKAANDNAQQ
jgi:hypothetical protein